MSEELANNLTQLLVGSGGASVVIATIMGYIKAVWKPEPKWKYWFAAAPMSLAAVAGILWYLSYWNWLVWIASSALVCLAELLGNNKAWPHIKAIFILLLQRVRKEED